MKLPIQEKAAALPRSFTIEILDAAVAETPVDDFLRVVLVALQRESACQRVVAELRHDQVGCFDARLDDSGFDFTPVPRGASHSPATDDAFVLPLSVGDKELGLLRLHGASLTWDLEALHALGSVLAVTLTHKRTHALLRERLKELTCFYGIAEATSRRERTLPAHQEKGLGADPAPTANAIAELVR